MDFSRSKMSCASSGTGMLSTKLYLGTVLKQIDLAPFFFPSYGSLASCLHYLNTEASKWFKTGKGNGFLGACGSFRHLSNWTIYDLTEQFSKLAPWNMHLPTVAFFCSNGLCWFILIYMNKSNRDPGTSFFPYTRNIPVHRDKFD